MHKDFQYGLLVQSIGKKSFAMSDKAGDEKEHKGFSHLSVFLNGPLKNSSK